MKILQLFSNKSEVKHKTGAYYPKIASPGAIFGIVQSPNGCQHSFNSSALLRVNFLYYGMKQGGSLGFLAARIGSEAVSNEMDEQG